MKFIDVSSILSMKDCFGHPFSIKPDLTPEERCCDSLLLKERCCLIQCGTDHIEIKTCGSRVYLNKRLYWHIVFPSNSTVWTVCSQRSCVVPVTQRFTYAILL